MDPKAFRGEGEFEQDLDHIIDTLHETPASDPARPVLVAGEPENHHHQRRSAEGIPLSAALIAQLREICQQSRVAYLLEDQ